MRSGLFLPLFDQLADPALVRLAGEAEEAGWHGVFVGPRALAGAGCRGGRPVDHAAALRLGPVTPCAAAARSPGRPRRSTVSGGRLTLGVGLGSDEFGSEYSMTGEEVDDRRRARMLDESLEILAAAWSGEPHHRGEHYTVDGMLLPRPVQASSAVAVGDQRLAQVCG